MNAELTERELAPTIPCASREKVSVIIPAFNDRNTIIRAIDSVRRQTYPGIEIIVVDDGSTDDTHDLARQVLRDTHQSQVLQQANRGLGAARAVGAGLAKGMYLAFLDADDEYHPEKIMRQVHELRFLHRAVLFTGACIRDEKGKVFIRQGEGGVQIVTDAYASGRVKPGCHASLMMRRADYYRWGGFDPSMRRNCEPEFFLRILADRNAQIAILNEPLYEMHESLTSNRHKTEGRLPYIGEIFWRAAALIEKGAQIERRRILVYVHKFAWRVAINSLLAPPSFRAALQQDWARVNRCMPGIVPIRARVMLKLSFRLSQKAYISIKGLKRALFN